MNPIKYIQERYFEIQLEGRLEMMKSTEANRHIMDFLSYCDKVRRKGFENLYLRYIYDYQDWKEEKDKGERKR